MFEDPKAGEFTQGIIFSCAYGENYEHVPVYGLVITARCDAAQEKVPVFSYVPVVPLSSWILVDGGSVILDRLEADCTNAFRNALKTSNLSESLLRTHSLQAIYDAHFRPHEEVKARKSQCEKLKNTVSDLHEIQALQENMSDVKGLRSCLHRNRQKLDAVLKDLAANKLAGNYLLRGLQTYTENESDFVVLLREVHHVPTSTARKIAKGLADKQFKSEFRKYSPCPRYFQEGDVALPVSKLTSPWIEHLMQHFALLFSRIGVRDNDADDLVRSFSLEVAGDK